MTQFTGKEGLPITIGEGRKIRTRGVFSEQYESGRRVSQNERSAIGQNKKDQ